MAGSGDVVCMGSVWRFGWVTARLALRNVTVNSLPKLAGVAVFTVDQGL